MEPQYHLMKGLLMFIVLSFGFILLLYSEFLRFHDKLKTQRIIIRILGVALILFFLIFSGWVKFSWEWVFKLHRTFDENRQVYTFSQDIAFWKKEVSALPFWEIIIFFLMFLFMTFAFLVGIFIDFRHNLRDELKEWDIFNIHELVFRGFGYALFLVVGIYSLFQLGSFTMAIGYKLFY